MTTGIAQKSCTTLFPFWSLRKNDISKMKKKIQRGNIESIERNLNFKQRKNKSKKYTYPDYARTAVSAFFLFVAISTGFSFT